MQNFIQPYHIITVPAPYDLAEGACCKVGGIFGVANYGALETELVDIRIWGAFDLLKAGSQAWAVGDLIYWDDSAKMLTNVVGTNFYAGLAIAAVGAGEEETIGRVMLCPLGGVVPTTI